MKSKENQLTKAVFIHLCCCRQAFCCSKQIVDGCRNELINRTERSDLCVVVCLFGPRVQKISTIIKYLSVRRTSCRLMTLLFLQVKHLHHSPTKKETAVQQWQLDNSSVNRAQVGILSAVCQLGAQELLIEQSKIE